MKGNVAGMPRRYTSYQQTTLSNQLFPYSTASPNEPLPREVILVVILLRGNELYEPYELFFLFNH